MNPIVRALLLATALLAAISALGILVTASPATLVHRLPKMAVGCSGFLFLGLAYARLLLGSSFRLARN